MGLRKKKGGNCSSASLALSLLLSLSLSLIARLSLCALSPRPSRSDRPSASQNTALDETVCLSLAVISGESFKYVDMDLGDWDADEEDLEGGLFSEPPQSPGVVHQLHGFFDKVCGVSRGE